MDGSSAQTRSPLVSNIRPCHLTPEVLPTSPCLFRHHVPRLGDAVVGHTHSSEMDGQGQVYCMGQCKQQVIHSYSCMQQCLIA